MSYLSTAWTVGPILGPFIGGYLQHYFNWQANFYFFSLYGLFIFICSIILMFETNLEFQTFRMKKFFKDVWIISTNALFFWTAFINVITFSSYIIFNMTGPFLIQDVLHKTAVFYGHAALFLGVAYFIGTLFNQILVKYFNLNQIILLGSVSSLFFSILMLCLAVFLPMNSWNILIPVMLVFFSTSVIFPNIAAKNMQIFPKLAGLASAVYGAVVVMGAFIITFLAALLKTDTQIPMSIAYVILFVVALTLAFVCRILQKKS